MSETWQIDLPMRDGAVASVNWHVREDEADEIRQFVAAMVQGLRGAGFDPEVTHRREVAAAVDF